MADTPAASDPDQEAINGPMELASFWLNNISYAERKVKSFRTRGDQIVRRYKNKRSTAVPTVTNITVGQRRMNVLWANVQTQKPVLYSQTPKPNVTRRNKDKDPIGRWAAIVLERVLINTLDMQPFDHVMNQDVENLLLPGYACSMVEYIPEVENDQIGWQEARMRYVHWKDQLTNPARYWQEVWWWGYVSYLTRKEVRERYGNEIALEIVLDHKQSKGADDTMSKATVWCVWDSIRKKVIHISTGYAKAPLGEYDPPVNFEGFFPIPMPLVATTATDTLIPVPDFDQYQDQCDEIDILTQRIYVLTRSLKLRGLYPGDMQSVRQMMDAASDADMIPIENWQMFQERGGIESMIAYFPIEMVAKTLQWCYEARGQAIQAMQEITGISDIVRGETDPNETLGAQQLKSQYSGVRIRERQRDVQRYIRDLLRHMSSVIGQHFTMEVLQKMSGVPLMTKQQKQMAQQAVQMWQQYGQAQQEAAQMAQQTGLPPQQLPPPGIPQPPEETLEALKEPSWEQVIGLLRDEKLRGFIIDVETDSTVEADQQAQQQKAEAFLTAVTQYVGAWAQILPGAPFMAPLAGEMLMASSRLFKMGDQLETVIEEVTEAMEKMAKQPPPPNPQMEIEKTKAQTAGVQANAEVQKAGAEVEGSKIDLAGKVIDLQAQRQQLARDAQPQEPAE